MKTILYATDYSENSVPALWSAFLLAEKFDAKLIVMHVFDIPIFLASPVSVTHMNNEKKRIVENRAKLKNFIKEFLGHPEDKIDMSFVFVENRSVWSGIQEKAIKFNADLIVVGTKGISPVREFLLGGTTKALIKNATCPVLAVPEGAGIENLNTMVYATDFEQADIFAINRLVKIAEKFDAAIKVLHITTKKEYAGEELMEWFKDMLEQKTSYENMEFELIFSDAIFKELNEYLNHTSADLLVMLERKGRNFFEKYIQKDMVKKMVSEITVPLLSFNS
ncbi:Nucleotide-binding universal stress protein, UspA family [Pricia antarctica]|uniref:Nucleotide-binding universal stress protein, UspA family n=1 Tax=Pricia antarctica TaxID=641691 RepID=A0A1G7C477_9FLAO|nr:universal stress protein [Pricia antarctica]SDE34111.1 Nucleotide-binding universal stress protein, UspA family [Pricia antarctica]